ncbi:MAG: hypothetical protein K8L99_06595 [Anaerolineae bacterium]|nr:hypothetical protein [Anaerolineae bacterium]
MRKARRILLAVLVILAVYAAYYIYIGPRVVGDAFAVSLINVDTESMSSHLCEDTTVAGVLNALGTTDDQVSLLVIGVLRGLAPQAVVDAVSEALEANTRYDPFTGEYYFSLTLGTDISLLGTRFASGATTPEYRLMIQRGWLRPCVLAI